MFLPTTRTTHAPTTQTRQELLERLKRRRARLAELADAYSSKIYQLAFRYLRNKEDAEEVTQDVLFKVYRKVGAFRGDAALSSWIYRITFNAAMSRLRTAHVSAGAGRTSATQAVADGEDAGDRARAGRRRLVATWPTSACCGRSCAGACSARSWRCRRSTARRSMLRDIQGMSTEEASAMLQVKDQTLKSRLHRGRLILRKQLADFAGGLTLHRPIYGTLISTAVGSRARSRTSA